MSLNLFGNTLELAWRNNYTERNLPERMVFNFMYCKYHVDFHVNNAPLKKVRVWDNALKLTEMLLLKNVII